MKRTKLAALMSISIGALGAAPALAQSNPNAVKVLVGYADTEHSSPGFTPFPVPLPAGVVFIGTSGMPFDAGVIELINPSAQPLQVDSVTVDIGPTLGINPWSSATPFTIPGKGTAILTQTATFNFDTSDIPSITCTPDGFIPVIHVTVGTNLNTKTFQDVSQVLNTGGIDPATCTGANEGIPFTAVQPPK